MFDFLFKRSPRSPRSPAVPVVAAVPNKVAEAASMAALKQAALAQAEGIKGDEAAAAAFILQCTFADARLIAAAQLHSAPVLGSVMPAMRKTDRRVAKLLQARLDEIRQRAQSRQQADACLAKAQQLLDAPRLMANQAVDLDLAWQGIVLIEEDHLAAFAVIRSRLSARLEEQARVQHALLALLARLQQAHADEAADAMLPELLQDAATILHKELASTEAATLPAALARDIEAARSSLQERLDAHVKAAQQVVLETPLIENEASEPPPAVKYVDSVVKAVATAVKEEASAEAQQAFAQALDGLEKALQDGGLHAASECDRALRKLELGALHINEAQRRQLTAARAELNRLQAWARWGGNISREELLKAALALPAQSAAPLELAKKVGSLRERWKSLDTSAGPATNEAWRSFDAACSEAYAPAAAHFKKLAQEREQNLLKAEAMIAAVLETAVSLPAPAATDWKQLAQLCAQQSQAWQRLGTIERKEKKRLDRDFAQAMQGLLLPLGERRAEAIRQREQMIAKITALAATDASALETLRMTQERWQIEAQSLPLERQDEQALWLRFRAACDAVFAARKVGAAAADGERRGHQEEKEALCATLEAALGDAEPAIAVALRETQASWSRIGPVPRAVEKAIDARYQAAVAALQARLDLARRVALAAQSDALRDKLRLCQQAEAALLGAGDTDASLATLWENLPTLPAQFERALSARFTAATQADAAYVSQLDKNRAELATQLLRCEIMLGLDSPEELSRRRLQLQVEVLQSSLKAGQKPLTVQAQLLELCALPAMTDASDAQRIERIVVHLGD